MAVAMVAAPPCPSRRTLQGHFLTALSMWVNAKLSRWLDARESSLVPRLVGKTWSSLDDQHHRLAPEDPRQRLPPEQTMDPIGTVASIFSIWAVVCAVYGRIGAYRNYPEESRHVFLQLELVMHVLQCWCMEVGVFADGARDIRHPRLKDDPTRSLVGRTLSSIEAALAKLRPECSQDSAESGLLQGSDARSAKYNAALRRLRWTLGGQKKSLQYVQRIRQLVHDLHLLVPPCSHPRVVAPERGKWRTIPASAPISISVPCSHIIVLIGSAALQSRQSVPSMLATSFMCFSISGPNHQISFCLSIEHCTPVEVSHIICFY